MIPYGAIFKLDFMHALEKHSKNLGMSSIGNRSVKPGDHNLMPSILDVRRKSIHTNSANLAQIFQTLREDFWIISLWAAAAPKVEVAFRSKQVEAFYLEHTKSEQKPSRESNEIQTRRIDSTEQ